VVENMATAGAAKGKLAASDLVVRGILSGLLLGVATTLALQSQILVHNNVIGGIVFPVGFVMIVLLGLELVTGNFAIVPVGVLSQKITLADLSKNWAWVILGNLVGALIYAALFYAATKAGTPIATRIVEVAQAKTIAYEAQGSDGMRQVFFKAVLCNWMVTMGVVMAMTSTSTTGKIVAMWLPVTTIFVQGFEHAVVNMFVIPAGMLFGADVSVSDWLLWNQFPVTLGNIVGGFLLTGLPLYLTYSKSLGLRREPAEAPARMPVLEAGGADGGS
jgi:formate/nitrite transporter